MLSSNDASNCRVEGWGEKIIMCFCMMFTLSVHHPSLHTHSAVWCGVALRVYMTLSCPVERDDTSVATTLLVTAAALVGTY